MKNYFSSIRKKANFITGNNHEISDMNISKMSALIKEELFALDIDCIYVLSKKCELLSIIGINSSTIIEPRIIEKVIKMILLNFSKKKNCFFKIYCGDQNCYEILIYHSHLNIISIRKKGKKSINKIQKMFLESLSVVMYNFLGDDSEIIQGKKKKPFDSFQMKLFATFMMYPLIFTFERAIKFLIKKRNLITPSNKMNPHKNDDINKSKLKNITLIDYSNKDIIFDYRALLNKKHKQHYSITGNSIFNEILSQADKLVRATMTGALSTDPKETISKFISIELAATFPRILYIVKFLPINNGLILVSTYSVFRLSHESKYTEIDVRLPIELLINDIGFYTKSGSPLMINEPESEALFELFASEFLSSINTSTCMYSSLPFVSKSNSLKYFDTITLQAMSFAMSSTDVPDIIIARINKVLHDRYGKLPPSSSDIDSDNFMDVEFDDVYREIFKERKYSYNDDENSISPMNRYINSVIDENGRRISEIKDGNISDNTCSMFNDFNYIFATRKKSAVTASMSSLIMRSNMKSAMCLLGKVEDKIALLREVQTKSSVIDDLLAFKKGENGIDKRKSFQFGKRNFNFLIKDPNNNDSYCSGNLSNNILKEVYKDKKISEENNIVDDSFLKV